MCFYYPKRLSGYTFLVPHGVGRQRPQTIYHLCLADEMTINLQGEKLTLTASTCLEDIETFIQTGYELCGWRKDRQTDGQIDINWLLILIVEIEVKICTDFLWLRL